MPKRNAKGHFVKSSKARKSHASHAITKYRTGPTKVVTRYRSKPAPKHHRKRHHKGGGGMNLTHLAIAGAGLAFLAGPSSPIKAIPENIAKLPGAKTFGNAATAGLACLAIDRFVKRNRWLRAAGVIGVALGAVQLGTQGTNFKWVGDADDDEEYIGDVSQ